jgi:toxin ParE1/3/4
VSHRFSFHTDARSELREAVQYYASEHKGVGAELVAAVRAAIEDILDHPLSGTPYQSGTRRKVLAHFPYAQVYLIEQADVLIVAVAHQRRRPGLLAQSARAEVNELQHARIDA